MSQESEFRTDDISKDVDENKEQRMIKGRALEEINAKRSRRVAVQDNVHFC